MKSINLEAVFIKAFEANPEFMKIVHEFPDDIYDQRNSEEFNQKYPDSRYVKYAGYKEMIRFHAPKLLRLPVAAPGMTALDIGGGAGYLAFMLRALGYDPLILDVPETDAIKIMTRMRNALNIETVYAPIRAFTPMPELPHQPFSLVTAANLVFDDGWNLLEYAFWLKDIVSRVTDNAAIYIYFNQPQAEKIWDDPGFLGFFLNSGAEIIVPRRAFIMQDMDRLKRNLSKINHEK